MKKLRNCSPESEVITNSGVLVTYVVSRMCYPECSRSDVIVQQTGRGDNKHSQARLDDVSLEQQRKKGNYKEDESNKLRCSIQSDNFQSEFL